MKTVLTALAALTLHTPGPVFIREPDGPVHEYEQPTNADHHALYGLACVSKAKVLRFAVMTDGVRHAVEPVWPGIASLRFPPGRELTSVKAIAVIMMDQKQAVIADARCFADWTGTAPDYHR